MSLIPYVQSLYDNNKLYSTINTEWTKLQMISNTRHERNCGTCNSAEVHKFLSRIKAKPIANDEYKTKSVANGDDLKSMIRFLWTEAPTVYAVNRYRVQLCTIFISSEFYGIVAWSYYRK
ncbi:hypothetical protein L211DRAFT_850711 [Terfezia boudieri ATCC MYA-4762]|uniref:Uncharacterized protein n=1 Tax=Terfezia boudieri ATCC MYA-4762 TaxID=1051890 RepID=A0A3N4LHN9_9PEZI|nr:hypothetical protein L211DRAFT_850711 [Terfezia boudieri ATCC MYA-4762]